MDYRIPAFFAIIIVGFVAATMLYNFVYAPTNASGKVMKATVLAPIGMVGVSEVRLMDELVKNGTLVPSKAATAMKAQIGAVLGGVLLAGLNNDAYVNPNCGKTVSGGNCPKSSYIQPIQINNGACSRQSDCAPDGVCTISYTAGSHSIGYCEAPGDTSGTGGSAAVQTAYGYSCAEACTAYSWSGTISSGENDPYGCWASNGWASPEGCCCGPHSTFVPTAGFGESGTFKTQADLEKAQGGPFKGMPAESIAWYFSPDNKGFQGASWNHELLCGTDGSADCTRECTNAGAQSPAAVLPGGETCWGWCRPSAGFEHISAACQMFDNCNCPPDTPGYTGHYTPPGSGNTGGTTTTSSTTTTSQTTSSTTTTTTSQTTSSTTTTTQAAITFDGGKVSCTEVQDNVFRCTVAYTNNLGQDATVVFEYTNAAGNIISSPEAPASTTGHTSSTQFHCSAFTSGTYTVSWIAYKGTDFSSSVDSSKSSEIATIICS